MSECTYTKPITSYIMNKQNSLVNGWGHKKSLLPFLTLILIYETIYIYFMKQLWLLSQTLCWNVYNNALFTVINTCNLKHKKNLRTKEEYY